LLAGAALVLAPASGLAQSDDDAPIATAPEVHQPLPPPPESASDDTPPQTYAPRPAPYAPPPAPQPQQQTYAAPPRAAYAPPPASYATPQAPAEPPPPEQAPPAPTPPAAQAFAAPQTPGAAAGGAVAYATPSKRPSFLADTASKDAMAGALSFAGAALAINMEMQAGDKLVSANAIEDPAVDIARLVAADYAAARGGAVADTPSDWGAAGAGARYFVKVSTSGWGFTYYPLDWNHYHLTYDAKLEVVDVAAGRVVAKASCSHKADPAAERFTYDAMTGNGGELLKTQLKAIADECAAQFRTEVLKA
jgi:hypothetical protein